MNWSALLPELTLSAGVLTLFTLELLYGKKAFKAATLLAALFLALAAVSTLFTAHPERLFFGGFTVDALSLAGKLLLYALAALVLVSSYDYFIKRNSPYGELPYLYLLAVLGMSVMLSSDNLAVVFTGLELSSITLYLLAGLFKNDYPSKEGAFKYLVIGTTGTSMFALGSAFVYAATGSLRTVPYEGENAFFALGVVLILSALALKASAVPFHFWTPDAYEGAPTPTTAFMAAVPKLALYFLLVKLTYTLLSSFEDWRLFVVLLAVASMLVGNLAAYAQTSLKRLFAYSSVAHAGYFLTALTAVDEHLFAALLFYVFAYGTATVGVFTLLTVLEKALGRPARLDDLKGLYRTAPGTALLFALFLFAFIGIPPLALFWGKLGIFFGLVKAELFTVGVLFALGSLLSVGYYLRLVVLMFLTEPEREVKTALSGGEAFTLSFAALATLALGLAPQTVLDLLLRALP
ncbi:MAG: NADH-quinone oxidoreductase subunit N [Aquificae bacterium]|nr:NADH-quinone oxidoreductase subunit N [Aquificota bacterium]